TAAHFVGSSAVTIRESLRRLKIEVKGHPKGAGARRSMRPPAGGRSAPARSMKGARLACSRTWWRKRAILAELFLMVSARVAPVPPAKFFRHIAADATGQQHQIQDLLKCPTPKTIRKVPSGVRTSSPATNGIAAFAVTASCTRRWYANTLLTNEHNETMPPSMYEYFHGAVWQRKKPLILPCNAVVIAGDSFTVDDAGARA